MTITQELQSMIGEMRIVSDLNPGDRPQQDKDKKIVGKYEPPSNGYIPSLSRPIQALGRTINTQSTEASLERINVIANQIMQCVKIKTTPFEYYMNFSSQIEQCGQLLELMTKTVEQGLPNFLETSTSCSSSLFGKSKQEIDDRKIGFETTMKKVKIVQKTLTDKIEEYENLNMCASLKGLPAVEEHLQCIIEMILFPDEGFNVSTLNINGFRDFCSNITRNILEQSFSKEHVTEVLRFYNLERALRFTYPDLQAIIIGIVANLTFRDVVELLKKTDGIAYKVLLKRSNGLPNKINEQALIVILDILRSIDIGGAHCPTNRCYGEQLCGDLLLLESCKKFKFYDWNNSEFSDAPLQQLRIFGRVEQFAREYSFALQRTKGHQFREGILFPNYDEKGNPTCFEAYNICTDSDIFAIAAIPQPDTSKCKSLAHISFRGSYQQENLPTCKTETTSSGWLSYKTTSQNPSNEAINNSLVALLLSIINRMKTPDQLKIEISGQGIGGCAAQRFTEVLAKHFADQKGESSQINLKEVNMYCFDSPAVEDPTTSRFIKDTLQLHDINFNLRYFSSHIRKLTWYGNHYLGYVENKDDTHPLNLNITWMAFEFFHKDGVHEQLADAYPVKPLILQRFYKHPDVWGNNDPFFFERNRYELTHGNPVSLKYYCTTNEDRNLIPKSNIGKMVKLVNLPDVLTAGFDYETHKKNG